MGENEITAYNEVLELNGEEYYSQAYQESEAEFITMLRPIDALLEEEKDSVQMDAFYDL